MTDQPDYGHPLLDGTNAWNQEEMDRAFLRVQIRQANALEHIHNTLERIYKYMPTGA